MKATIKLAETTTPDGGRFVLYEHAGHFCIRLNGLQLMDSAASASELLLGDLAVATLSHHSAPRILIGGLGLGFTLRRVLHQVGAGAQVQVAELMPQVVAWNRQFLSGLNGALLDDPRVEVLVGDVWELLTRLKAPAYDALLFDVDNGPQAMVQQKNARLYSRPGLERIAAALNAGGRAVFWSADPAPAFHQRLRATGFAVQSVPARFCATDPRCAGMIYMADKARNGVTP